MSTPSTELEVDAASRLGCNHSPPEQGWPLPEGNNEGRGLAGVAGQDRLSPGCPGLALGPTLLPFPRKTLGNDKSQTASPSAHHRCCRRVGGSS